MSDAYESTQAGADVQAPEKDKALPAAQLATQQGAHAQAKDQAQAVSQATPVAASITRIAPSMPTPPLVPQQHVFHRGAAPAIDPGDIVIDTKPSRRSADALYFNTDDTPTRVTVSRATTEYAWWVMLFGVFGLDWLFKTRKTRLKSTGASLAGA